jgi:hypothetical protein
VIKHTKIRCSLPTSFLQKTCTHIANAFPKICFVNSTAKLLFYQSNFYEELRRIIMNYRIFPKACGSDYQQSVHRILTQMGLRMNAIANLQ